MSGKQLEIRLEGNRVSVCLIFERLTFFQSRDTISGSYQKHMRISVTVYFHQYLIFSILLILAILIVFSDITLWF